MKIRAELCRKDGAFEATNTTLYYTYLDLQFNDVLFQALINGLSIGHVLAFHITSNSTETFLVLCV